LRNEAYVAERLDAQLSDQLTRFLADPSRGLRVEGNTLWVSKIFKWYAKDFVPSGKLTAQTLWPVIERYVPMKEVLFGDLNALHLKFLEYDWSLNARNT
jgi:hypothetical protein